MNEIIHDKLKAIDNATVLCYHYSKEGVKGNV